MTEVTRRMLFTGDEKYFSNIFDLLIIVDVVATPT